MRFPFRRLLPLSTRIILALISFGLFSGLFGPETPQAAAATATTTTLTSNPNPSIYGQAVSFTAIVAGSNPQGYVTFTDVTTSTVLGSVYTYGGVAGISTSTPLGMTLLTVGTHQITASYAGFGGNAASVSPVLQQVVNKFATSTVLYSSINPSLSGQSNTVTADINNSAGGPATGTITFVVDGTPQTASINGYSATYDASSLPAGTHTITATYSGDSNFTSSTSQAFTQTVNPHVNPQYVSASGSDSNPGTLAAPKLTIQAAINIALTGDTVIVENGTYTGPGDVDLDFGGKNLTVTSQNGAATTIIDCGGTAIASHRGFYLHSGETNAVISGLTIQNGNNGYGGGIYCGGVSAAIQNCILKNNTASFYGGGLDNYSTAGNAVSVTNCVFAGNTAGSNGGGLYSYNNSGTTAVTNCTFTGNGSTRSGTDNGGGIYAQFSGMITLTNDILYGDAGGELGNQYGSHPTYYTIINCDIQGGYTGGGNISADPYFYNSPADLHLQAGSPCLGAGTASGAPATALDGRSRPPPPKHRSL